MSKPIIEVEHLSKCYRIGAMRDPYLSLREELAKKTRRISSAFSRAFRNGQDGQSDSETDFWALNDVSFSVQEGEAIGIIGRNGAGKSTLLKILSRITPPTKGQITMRGKVASLLEVGTGFHPELTGRENIFLNGAIMGMGREEIRRKFDEIVAFAEIEKFLDTPVKRFSSGMYVRLAFAVAAHLEPEILVVDEVLAVGDTEFQKKCLGKMGEVAVGGRTVLFVSHNMAAVKTLCSRGVLLDAGRVTMMGIIEDCIDQYIGANHSGGNILAHIEVNDPRVHLDVIQLNGYGTDVIEISPDTNFINIEVEGKLDEPLPLDVELQITDMQGIPLAIYSSGHERGHSELLGKGYFILRRKVFLPRITQGHFVVNIGLTDAGNNYWVRLPRAAILSAHGTATKTGIVFAYNRGSGFVWLEDIGEQLS